MKYQCCCTHGVSAVATTSTLLDDTCTHTQNWNPCRGLSNEPHSEPCLHKHPTTLVYPPGLAMPLPSLPFTYTPRSNTFLLPLPHQPWHVLSLLDQMLAISGWGSPSCEEWRLHATTATCFGCPPPGPWEGYGDSDTHASSYHTTQWPAQPVNHICCIHLKNTLPLVTHHSAHNQPFHRLVEGTISSCLHRPCLPPCGYALGGDRLWRDWHPTRATGPYRHVDTLQ